MIYGMQDARRIKIGFNPFAKGFTPEQLTDAYYKLTCEPKQQLLILESCSIEEADGEYGGNEVQCDSGCLNECAGCEAKRDDGMVMEAVRVRQFSRTAQTMAALAKALNRYMADKGLTVGEAVIGRPRKSGLFATVTVQFPVSDGQTITIIFHSPDNNKLQITGADEILAFRWLLNKRDITVAVSPEGEADVSLEEVGKRVAMLVEKNAKMFAAKSKEIADQKQALADVQTQVTTIQGENATLTASLAEVQSQSDQLDADIQATQAQLDKVVQYNADLQAKIDAAQAIKAGNAGKAAGDGLLTYQSKKYGKVLAKMEGGEPYPYTYANRKQADDAVAKLAEQGITASVAGTRPFFVKIEEATNPDDTRSKDKEPTDINPNTGGGTVADPSLNLLNATNGFTDLLMQLDAGHVDGYSPKETVLNIDTKAKAEGLNVQWTDSESDYGTTFVGSFTAPGQNQVGAAWVFGDGKAMFFLNGERYKDNYYLATEDFETQDAAVKELADIIKSGVVTNPDGTPFVPEGDPDTTGTNTTGDDTGTGGDTTTGTGNPEEDAAVAILNDILAGNYADSGSISDALDQAAGQLEGAGLMEKHDALLNQAADYLTEVLKKEAA